MSLSAQVTLQIVAAETTTEDLATTVRSTNVLQVQAFSSSAAEGPANVTWSDTRTIVASENDTIDLLNLTDARGTVAFSVVKAIYIRNTSEADDLALGFSTPANAWTGRPIGVMPAAGWWMFSSGLNGASIVSGSQAFNVDGLEGQIYEIVVIGYGTIS